MERNIHLLLCNRNTNTTLNSLTSVKPDTVTPLVRWSLLLPYRQDLLRSIDRNGFNFFGFYKVNLDYEQNFTAKKKKTV